MAQLKVPKPTKQPKQPRPQKVKSSFIKSVSYSPREKKLEVNINKKTYEFYKVPSKVFNNLLSAKSKGKYFNKHLKGKYQAPAPNK